MKKIWFILFIICTVCVTACSDDDNNIDSSDGPVKGYVLPPFVRLGTEMVIPGNGFSSDAQLYVKNEAGDLIQIPTKKITSSGILFTVPTTLERGMYNVILKQNGDWVLGEWAVKDIIQVKRLKSISIMFGDFGMPSDLKYDYENRLIAFSSVMTSTVYSLKYEEDRIEVTGVSDDGTRTAFTFQLNEGRIASSSTEEKNVEWTYTTDGYLEGIGDNLYTFETGNLITTTNSDAALGDVFLYDQPEWKATTMEIDIAACIMFFNGAMEDSEFLAFLLGMNGKKSVLLPSSFYGVDFSYIRDNDDPQGAVKEAVWADMGMSVTFEYETAEALL